MACAYDLALSLVETDTTGHFQDGEDEDMISSWADGLFHKYYYERVEDRHAPRSRFSSGMTEEEFEPMVDAHILTMERVKQSVG